VSRAALTSNIFFMTCVKKMDKTRSKLRTLTCHYFKSHQKKREEDGV